MPYYHDLITGQSFAELQRLKSLLPFVLIGGWAVYFYTHGLKSRDIDIVVEYDALPKLGDRYTLVKNDRLKKYEAVSGPVQIDVYLPHYSRIGLPAEEILTHTCSLEGFTLPDLPRLLVLKIFALGERGHSTKGEKDFCDIMALLALPEMDSDAALSVLGRFGLQPKWETFLAFLRERSELPELGLSKHAYAKIRRRVEGMSGKGMS